MRIVQFIILFLGFFSCNTKNKSVPSYELKSDSLNIQAREFLATNKLDSAEYYISKSLYFDPGNYGAYNNRAILKFRKNKPRHEVVADFEKALSLNPSYEVSLVSLPNYYDMINDYENVIKACKRFQKKSKMKDSGNVKQITDLLDKAQRIMDSTKNIK